MAHSRFRYLNCQAFQPNRWTSIALAIRRGVPGDWSWSPEGATAARGAAKAVRVTAAAWPGCGRLMPVIRAALPVVVLAKASTTTASARVIRIEMRWYVRLRDNGHLWSGAP